MEKYLDIAQLVLLALLWFRMGRLNRPLEVKQVQPGIYAHKFVTKKLGSQ